MEIFEYSLHRGEIKCLNSFELNQFDLNLNQIDLNLINLSCYCRYRCCCCCCCCCRRRRCCYRCCWHCIVYNIHSNCIHPALQQNCQTQDLYLIINHPFMFVQNTKQSQAWIAKFRWTTIIGKCARVRCRLCSEWINCEESIVLMKRTLIYTVICETMRRWI